MTDEEILNSWRLDSDVTPSDDEWRDISSNDLLDLIRRVREDERQRCAVACEIIEIKWWEKYKKGNDPEFRGNQHTEGKSDGAAECAAAIRNRKDQP